MGTYSAHMFYEHLLVLYMKLGYIRLIIYRTTSGFCREILLSSSVYRLIHVATKG